MATSKAATKAVNTSLFLKSQSQLQITSTSSPPPHIMMRPQLRQFARHAEAARISLAARPFSASCIAREGENKPTKPPGNTQSPRKPRGPPTGGAPNRRPAKAIDARSFAAPTAGSDQPRLVRSPRLRTFRPNNGPGGGKPGPNNKRPGKPLKNAKRRERRPREKREDVDESLEEAEAAAIQAIENEVALKERPVPVRYEPAQINFDSLRATWPSLPADAQSRSATVLSKMASVGGRFANGYIPPHELGRRLWQGENVLFESVAEKEEALAEVGRLAQVRADKISQAKGELVQAKEVKFEAVGKEESGRLVEKFALGKYPGLQGEKKGQHAAVGDVLRNLRNNGTYETAGKRAEFVQKVEALLAPRVKRA